MEFSFHELFHVLFTKLAISMTSSTLIEAACSVSCQAKIVSRDGGEAYQVLGSLNDVMGTSLYHSVSQTNENEFCMYLFICMSTKISKSNDQTIQLSLNLTTQLLRQFSAIEFFEGEYHQLNIIS